MGIFAFASTLVLAVLFLIHKHRQIDSAVNKKITVNDFQEPIELALSLPSESERDWQHEHTSFNWGGIHGACGKR